MDHCISALLRAKAHCILTFLMEGKYVSNNVYISMRTTPNRITRGIVLLRALVTQRLHLIRNNAGRFANCMLMVGIVFLSVQAALLKI